MSTYIFNPNISSNKSKQSVWTYGAIYRIPLISRFTIVHSLTFFWCQLLFRHAQHSCLQNHRIRSAFCVERVYRQHVHVARMQIRDGEPGQRWGVVDFYFLIGTKGIESSMVRNIWGVRFGSGERADAMNEITGHISKHYFALNRWGH